MTISRPVSGRDSFPLLAISTMKDGFFSAAATWGSSSAWGTANRAVYIPVRVTRACVVRKLGASVTATATGNIDIGIYSQSGTRLVSTGSTAKTTSTVQVIDITDTTLTPGLYYLALNNDTTTDTFAVTSDQTAPVVTARGVLTEEVGAVTLPSTATWVHDQALTFTPVIAALLQTELT